MMPMTPPFDFELAHQALSVAWTLNSTTIPVLAALFVPWIVIALLVIVDVLGGYRRSGEVALPGTTMATTRTADTMALGCTELPRVAA